MRPSLSLWSKASRLPLNSKKANKDFYKGTRTGNIMVRKRIAVANRNTGEDLYDDRGRVRTWNLKTHRIDENRVTSYIVPPGLEDSKVRVQCKTDALRKWPTDLSPLPQLQPLVFLGTKTNNGVEERPSTGGYPGAGKMRPGGGLDAAFYEQLRPSIWERRLVIDETRRDLSKKSGDKS